MAPKTAADHKNSAIARDERMVSVARSVLDVDPELVNVEALQWLEQRVAERKAPPDDDEPTE